jgi:hypothetical protein
MQANDRRNSFILGIGMISLAGFIIGLPLYIVGITIKIRDGTPFQSALQGFHLGVQIYLTFIGPVIFSLIKIIFSPNV